MPHCVLRFYAELNVFVPHAHRQADWTQPLAGHRSILHLIEDCGVPHTEVALILRNGARASGEETVEDGDRISVYPAFEGIATSGGLSFHNSGPRPLRFVADAHLGELARRLRLLGFDTLWFNDVGDPELARLSHQQERVLLTRDRKLLMRREVDLGCYVHPRSTDEQMRYLLQRYQLCDEINPFTRCTVCNGRIVAANATAVRDIVPPGVFAVFDRFWSCVDCGKVYWQGSHWESMSQFVAAVCPDAFRRIEH